MTGNWPASVAPGEWLYGLAWFAIPALFTAMPLTVAGFVGGGALRIAMTALTPHSR
jgi:hypothetical protein